MSLLPRTTVLPLLFFTAGPALGQAALSPGRTLRLEFPELPPTFQAMWDSTDAKPAVSVRLPDDYTAEGAFPLFVHLEGGHGGNGANLGVPLQVTQGKGYVAANFPLFKRLKPDPARSWTIAVGADDAGKIGPAYRTILERLNTLIPNLDPGRSILGGHSNGAHTVAALLSVLDETTLASYGGFYFVDGGLDWSSFKRTEVLGGHSIFFLVGGRDLEGEDDWWRGHLRERAAFLRRGAQWTKMTRWRFEVFDGVGHEFAREYFPKLREWAAAVDRAPASPKKATRQASRRVFARDSPEARSATRAVRGLPGHPDGATTSGLGLSP